MKKSFMGWSVLDPIIFAGLFVKGKIIPGFKPKRTDLVIDIGCGDKPFWRADVFFDNLKLGNEQRFSGSGVKIESGKFVNGDIGEMPFRNKSFDFSYCSHVLEHVPDPGKAIEEIQRISKGGYIEIPSALHEILNPYHSHLWFVFKDDETLVFLRKSKNIHRELFMQSLKYRYLDKLMGSPFIAFYWNKRIRFKIVSDINKSEFFSPMKGQGETQSGYVQKSYLIISKILRYLYYSDKTQKIGQVI